MKRIFVKPARNMIVREPHNAAALPPEGREVEDSTYWQRRINDGDVFLVTKKSNRNPAPAEPTQQGDNQ